MNGRYAAVVGLCAALTLAACGGLSTTSTVQPGLQVGAVQENQVLVEANPLAPGSTPVQVVNGFIRAAAASDDQYQVARSYLGPTSQTSWRPDAGVVVFPDDSALTIVAAGPTSVKAIAKASARIDSSGRYQELPANTTVQVTFGVQRIEGEWRISAVPDGFGTWLGEADVARLYDPFRIFFVSATERRLVPDLRWFPLGTGLATRLARALLAGVPDYLRGAVRTDVPAGTRLAVDAVPIDTGTAKVDLTAARLGADPAQRQNLGAQFLATVSQAPGVQRVALQLEGTDLQVPGGGASLDSLAALGFTTFDDPVVVPVIRNGSTLVQRDPQAVGNQLQPSRSALSLPAVSPGWAYLAMSRAGREIAAVSGDRTQLARWRGTAQVQVLTLGSRLTRPAYDRQDMLWLGGRSGGVPRIWVVNTLADPADPKARPQPVSVDWLAGRTLVSLRPSPDGQRVALLTVDQNGVAPRVDVAGVVRDSAGIPTGLSRPLNLAPSLTLARDLVWVDDATLAVLGRKTSVQVVRPWIVPLGGPITAGPEISGALSISTVNAERGLVVTTDGGEVLIRAGNRWQFVGKGTDFLVAAH
jgi:hypothetical protein